MVWKPTIVHLNHLSPVYRLVFSYIPSAQDEHLSNVVLENIVRIKETNTE